MKGTAHAAIGAVTGTSVAIAMNTGLVNTVLLACIGSVTALVPDLDVNGKLANSITVEKKWLVLFFAVSGLLLAIYSYFMLFGIKQITGFLTSIGLLLLPRLFIKQRMMLFVTGAVVTYAGWYMQEKWILYIGLFIVFASLVSHRTWTHSFIGFFLFYFVAEEITRTYPMQGLFATFLLSYLSHLAADMKLLPANKKGVKFFYPISKKEF